MGEAGGHVSSFVKKGKAIPGQFSSSPLSLCIVCKTGAFARLRTPDFTLVPRFLLDFFPGRIPSPIEVASLACDNGPQLTGAVSVEKKKTKRTLPNFNRHAVFEQTLALVPTRA